MRYIVACLDPRAPSRGILRRCDHLDRAILLRDRQAKPAIAAFGLGPQILEIARVEEARMRVEAGEHAVDRALDQLFVIDLFDIVAADFLEDVHELVERLVAARFPVRERGRGGGDERERAKGNGAPEEIGFHCCPESWHQAISIGCFSGIRKASVTA